MATAKKDAVKTTAAKTTAKKVDEAPVKKAATTVKTTKKAETKTPAKTTVKKEEAKAVAKTTVKKTAAKTTTKKTAAKKENNLFVQFHGMEFDTKAIEKAVKDDYKTKNGKKTMTSVSIYVKPEDMKAYYVIDGIIGDVAL